MERRDSSAKPEEAAYLDGKAVLPVPVGRLAGHYRLRAFDFRFRRKRCVVGRDGCDCSSATWQDRANGRFQVLRALLNIGEKSPDLSALVALNHTVIARGPRGGWPVTL